MSKTSISLIVVVVSAFAAAGGYYFLSRTEVTHAVTLPPQSSSPEAKQDPKERPKPNHGDFEKRFEPTPPPSNGGKSK
jgi:hypothetical protein